MDQDCTVYSVLPGDYMLFLLHGFYKSGQNNFDSRMLKTCRLKVFLLDRKKITTFPKITFPTLIH